jgi:hypothetical protein
VTSGLNKEILKKLALIGKWSYIDWNIISGSLEKSLIAVSRNVSNKYNNASDDITVRILIMMSFFFFLIYILFPSSFLKRWNAS